MVPSIKQADVIQTCQLVDHSPINWVIMKDQSRQNDGCKLHKSVKSNLRISLVYALKLNKFRLAVSKKEVPLDGFKRKKIHIWHIGLHLNPH